MSANEILKNYFEALQMSDSSPIDFKNVVLDILKYLANKESGKDRGDESYDMIPQYKNNKLWKEIQYNSTADLASYVIELSKLRVILEKYKILGGWKRREVINF